MKYIYEERAALDAALNRLGIEINQEAKGLLLKHLYLVLSKNKDINLTRINNVEDAVILHIEDSLSLLTEFGQELGQFCDLGTGAGYPGIPLAICTNNKGVLLDSVTKKITAVDEFIKILGLNTIKTASERSELYALKHKEEFDTVIARAVSSLDILLELSYPLLKSNGRLIALKGQCDSEEIEKAEKTSLILHMEQESVRNYYIGNKEYSRTLYVYKKIGTSSVKLPRRPGLAKKKPLCLLENYKLMIDV